MAVASSSVRRHLRQRRQRLEVVRRARRRRPGRPRGRSRAGPRAPARVEREAASRDSALADVGAGHLAHVEAVAGRAQGLVEPLDVVAGQAHELLVAAHLDIGRDRVEEHLLLHVLQVGAARRRSGCAPTRPPPWSSPLSKISSEALSAACASVELVLDRLGGGLGRERGRGADLRPARGARLRQGLVDAAQRRAGRFQQRAGLVGLDQRVGQRVGHAGRAAEGERRQRACSTGEATSRTACAS